MQRHFSSRGEAHAETVAAKMSARHKPSEKSAFDTPSRRKFAAGWERQALTSSSIKPEIKPPGNPKAN
jgi:hypothetical protein